MRYHSKKNRKTLTDKAHWQVGFEQSRSSRTRKSWKKFHDLVIRVASEPAELPVESKIPRKQKTGKITLADLVKVKNTPL